MSSLLQFTYGSTDDFSDNTAENIYDSERGELIDGASVPKNCPPVFVVHTDDDRSSSLGSVLFYAGLKRHGIPAELHVYGNGGQGYGLRPVTGSQIRNDQTPNRWGLGDFTHVFLDWLSEQGTPGNNDRSSLQRRRHESGGSSPLLKNRERFGKAWP